MSLPYDRANRFDGFVADGWNETDKETPVAVLRLPVAKRQHYLPGRKGRGGKDLEYDYREVSTVPGC